MRRSETMRCAAAILAALTAGGLGAPGLAAGPERAHAPTPRPSLNAAAPTTPEAERETQGSQADQPEADEPDEADADTAPALARQASVGAAMAEAARISGAVGFAVIDVVSGEVLEAWNADQTFAPASVAKAPTAIYALTELGAQHRFETRVEARGALEGRLLRGALALVGGGDPELDSRDVATLARQVAATIERVDGPVVAEAGATVAAIDDSQPATAGYNPAVADLNLNFNRVRLSWARTGGALTHAVEAHAAGWSPAVGAVSVAFTAEDCGCPAFEHDAGAGRELWRVRPELLRGEGSVWLPVRAPEPYAAEVFAAALAQAGVATGAETDASVGPDAPAAVVARLQGRPLVEVVADMLEHSTNLTAEALGRAASAARGAPADDLAASAAAMNAWAAEWAGFPADAGFRLTNHSGLTPDSRVSPRRMAQFMRAAATAPDGALAALLPVHNIDEKQARAPKGSLVLAKTGTLDFVRGLSGFAMAPSGRVLAFAIFANDLPRREASRGLESPPPGARPWRNRATALERRLLRSWIERFG